LSLGTLDSILVCINMCTGLLHISSMRHYYLQIVCNKSSLTFVEAREKLSEFREDRTRNSEEVVDIWRDVLADFRYKLGDERK